MQIINYPHHPNLNNLEKLLNIYEAELEEIRTSLNNQFVKDFKQWQFLIEDSLAVLSLKYALGEKSDNIKNMFASISNNISSAIKTCNYLDRATYIKWLSVTAIVNDNETNSSLLNLLEKCLEHPSFVNTEYSRTIDRVISAFHAGEIEIAESQIDLAVDLFDGENYFLDTLVAMVDRVIAKDRAPRSCSLRDRLSQLVEVRANLFIQTYFQTEKNIVPAALLDINGLGILARARHTYGIKVLAESVYLPRNLLD